MRKARRWAVNALLLPLDYFWAGVFWMNAGMTISSRCGIAMLTGESGWKGTVLQRLGRALNRLDPNHCIDAIDGDLARIERTRQKLEPFADDELGI